MSNKRRQDNKSLSNPSRGGKTVKTAITTSQRDTCEVVVFRWEQPDITKIEKINAKKDRSLAGGGQSSANGNLKTKQRIMIIRNDVVRCNISKTKTGSSGTFSIELKRGKKVVNNVVQAEDINYLDAINQGDWVMIYMKKSGRVNTLGLKPEDGLKFIGIVENVRFLETDDPNRASPTLRYLVTGRDFGKVFDNTIYFNPVVNDATIQSVLGAAFLKDSSKAVKGDSRATFDRYTPDFVIKNLVSFFLGGEFDKRNENHQTWYIPKELGNVLKPDKKIKGQVSFIDVLNQDRIGMHKYNPNGVLQTPLNTLSGAAIIKAIPSNGTVWGVLEFFKNAALNEMYTELCPDANGNLQPSIILRQMPFSNFDKTEVNPFFKNTAPTDKGGNRKRVEDFVTAKSEKTFFANLPRTVIKSSDIRQKNVGKSDHERVNHVIVVPKIDFQSTFDIAYVTAYNIPSIQRHGLRSLQTQSAYCMKRGEGLENYLNRCVSLLMDWFFQSHMLYNGTLTIDGTDRHIEAGTNLFIEDVQQLYHIEGYTHTYQIAQDGKITYNTELRVSRGMVFRNGNTSFIGPSSRATEPTTISTSVLEGFRDTGVR